MRRISRNKLTLIILALIVVIGGVLIFTGEGSNNNGAISSFEECVDAGNPVMESYPRQCRTQDGRLFVEEIKDPQPGTDKSVRGFVTEIDTSQIAADGPALVVVDVPRNGEQTIALPSMGVNLCKAQQQVVSVHDVEVGDFVEVNGRVDAEGRIVPCESSDHYLRTPDLSGTVTLSVGEGEAVGPLFVRLEEVVQESRCPIDAECIEAGAITVRVTLQTPGEKRTVNIPSDEVPYEFNEYRISVADIQPPLRSGEEIAQSEYEITFNIETASRGQQ